jgi:CRP-like cAMP-binding protein
VNTRIGRRPGSPLEKGESATASIPRQRQGRVTIKPVLQPLGEREVFGEMAVLDPGCARRRSTVEDSRLLRLDQQALFEAMEERPEVARGIIRVLSRHLRNRMKDVTELRRQLEGAAQS